MTEPIVEEKSLEVLVEEAEKSLEPVVAGAQALIVEDVAGIEAAVAYGKTVKQKIAGITAGFEDMRAKAYDAYQSVLKTRDAALLPWQAAETLIKDKINTCRRIMDERAAEEQRIAEEKARIAAETARTKANNKLAAILGKTTDIKVQIEALEVVIDTADEYEAPIMQSKLEVLRAQLEGQHEKAAAIEERAVEAPVYTPPVYSAPAPKVAGMSSGFKMVPTITDKRALMAAALDPKNSIPLDIFDENMGKIKKLVSAGMQLPGVTVKKEYKTALRK